MTEATRAARRTRSTRSVRWATALGLAACLAVGASACSGSSDTSGSSGSSASTTKAPATSTTTTAPPVELPADRPVEVHVPSSVADGEAAPLVVLLHGYGVDGNGQAAYLRMTEAADEAGMLLVAPDGTENARGQRFWNATDACCGPGSEIDDSAYLADVIAKVSQDHAVDPDRIFVVGHSNGGFMANRMACDHADTIAAIVSIEGSTYEDASACDPSEPVSVLLVHGTADRTIPYDGGKIGPNAFPSAEGTLDRWVELDGCQAEADDPEPADHQIVKDLPPATVTAHSDCDDGTAVELWTQPDGVHIPPFTDDFSTQLLTWLDAHPKT